MLSLVKKFMFLILVLLSSSSVFSSDVQRTPTNVNYSSFAFPNSTNNAATNVIIATLLLKYTHGNTIANKIKGEFPYDLMSGRVFTGPTRTNPLLTPEQLDALGGIDKIKDILTPFYKLTKDQLLHIYALVKSQYADGITNQTILKAVLSSNHVNGDDSYKNVDDSYLVVMLFEKAYRKDPGHFDTIKGFIDQLS